MLNKIESPIVSVFYKLKISPNLLSVFGLILGIIAAVLIGLNNLIYEKSIIKKVSLKINAHIKS